MTMGVYLASLMTLMVAVLLPLHLAYVWRSIRRGDMSGGYGFALATFAIFGAAAFIPLFWMMAFMEP